MSATRITGQQVKDGGLTDADMAAANIDGASGTASLRTLGTGSAQACAGNDSRLSDSRAPTGTAGGGLGGTYPNPTVTGAVPPGTVIQSAAIQTPTGYLICDGSAVSRTTYAALFAATNGLAIIAMTIANPCVVSWTAHGMQDGTPVKFTTTGALPTGLVSGTTYYVKSPTANAFDLAATVGGVTITTTGSQSGTHTATVSPYGVGDGSTTFNLPDIRGRVPLSSGLNLGFGQHGMGAIGGEEAHILLTGEMPSHSHAQNTGAGVNAYGNSPSGTSDSISDPVNGKTTNGRVTTDAAGSDLSHNNMQPYLTLNFFIKV